MGRTTWPMLWLTHASTAISESLEAIGEEMEFPGGRGTCHSGQEYAPSNPRPEAASVAAQTISLAYARSCVGYGEGCFALDTDATRIYVRDLYDHTVQVREAIETYRDMLSGLLDIYLSSVSNTMNSVMKVLTIIGTIFIPLTFIAGVYGMNFVHMPELQLRWTYPAVLGLMLLIAIAMLIYFRRKKWL